VRAVLITGPPGSGKTSVLTALSDALSDDGVAHAALEVEAIVGTHPALDEDARLRHVRVNCALLRKAGPELLVVGDTVETSAELAALREAVGADEVFVVRLRAEPDTLAERIIAREPPGADLVLCTEGETAEAVAARIRETARL
jgi:broad-specificity NMP kinase